jgi:cell pole-organizing protein PopZ
MTSSDDAKPTSAEVLASLRRTIRTGVGQDAHHRDGPAIEQLDDFELPAMFRNERPPASTASLVERLSTALSPPALPGTHGVHAAETAPGPETRVPREMPPCRDRLVVRMAPPSKPAASAPPPLAHAVPKAMMGSLNYLIGAGSTIGEPNADDNDGAWRALPPKLPRMPGTLEADTAAQLRPVLQQWLDDNLNRVFTEALISTLRRDRET